MKRHPLDYVSRVLEWLSLLVDAHTPTRIRIKAVVVPATPPVSSQHRRISRDRASVAHHCDVPPWGAAGGSSYCPLCRTTKTYLPLPLPREEATAPHFVPRVRGRHNGHLRYTSGGLIDTGKLVKSLPYSWRT